MVCKSWLKVHCASLCFWEVSLVGLTPVHLLSSRPWLDTGIDCGGILVDHYENYEFVSGSLINKSRKVNRYIGFG